MSRRLNVKLKLQLIDTIDSWLKHRLPFRGQFAYELLSKVQLFLLSEETIKLMVGERYAFSKLLKCKDHIEVSLLHPKKEEMRFYYGTNLEILFLGGSSFLEKKKSRKINRAQKATYYIKLPR